ncbi:MAG: hypothetical protein Q9177_000770 [Variospora cf. flavescens]
MRSLVYRKSPARDASKAPMLSGAPLPSGDPTTPDDKDTVKRWLSTVPPRTPSPLIDLHSGPTGSPLIDLHSGPTGTSPLTDLRSRPQATSGNRGYDADVSGCSQKLMTTTTCSMLLPLD